MLWEHVIKVIVMTSPFIEPYHFTIKNILRMISGFDWKSLGIKLNLNTVKLVEMECKHRGLVGDCRYSMIEFWLTNDPTASWENLATALDGISEIKKVQEMMDLGMKEGE